MSKPFNHRLLHSALVVLEFALLWVLLSLQIKGITPVSLWTLLGTIVVLFAFTAHLVAISIQLVVPRIAVERHNLAIFFCVVGSILVALMLSSGIIIGMSYLSSEV